MPGAVNQSDFSEKVTMVGFKRKLDYSKNKTKKNKKQKQTYIKMAIIVRA